MSEHLIEQEEDNKKRGIVGSFVYAVIVLIILLFPILSYDFPIPGQEGILISFGEQNVGEGELQPDGEVDGEMVDEPVEPTPSESEPTAASEPIAAAMPPPSSSAPPPEEATQPDLPEKVLTSDKSKEISAREVRKKAREKAKKEAERKAKEKAKEQEAADAEKAREEAREKAKESAEAKERAEEEAKKQAEADAARKAAEDAKRKADEAREKAEEEARKKEEAKKKFGFPGSSGTSQGTSGNPGDAGVSDGDPDAKNLEGTQSYGQGDKDVGGGLKGRGVVSRPTPQDNSQKEGKVKVKICVNSSGKVSSAKYSIIGSTTQDSELVGLAEEAAKRYVFAASSRPEQCGDVTIIFTLQ